MKLNSLLILFLFHAIYAYNLFKPSTPSMKDQMSITLSDSAPDIDLTTLLDSPSRNSEVYTQAMISLQNLQGESFCHRLAVQLLMNNCKDIREISDQGLPFKHDAHKNQVEAFITGLTLCVLARGEFAISDSCAPFAATALHDAHQQGKRKLDVSREQNDACVATLSRDASQWATWLSQQREALTICRAVQLDIEKDETIFLHQQLTRIMEEFAGGLQTDLERLKRSMADQARAMDSQFESVLSQMKVKLHGTLQVAVNGFQSLSHNTQSTLESILDVNQMLRILRQTLVDTNAEVAAGHELAVSDATDLVVSRMKGINVLADDTSANLIELKDAINQLIPAVVSLSERQDATDMKAQMLYTALKDMTHLVNNQTESIEQASFAAKDLHIQMQEASAVVRSWTGLAVAGGSPGVWLARVILPPLSVVIGGWGLSGSMIRNLGLFLGTMGAIELPRQWYHMASRWTQLLAWFDRNHATEQSPSSFTQLPLQRVGSLIISPPESALDTE